MRVDFERAAGGPLRLLVIPESATDVLALTAFRAELTGRPAAVEFPPVVNPATGGPWSVEPILAAVFPGPRREA